MSYQPTLIFVYMFYGCISSLHAQVNEHFTDGNFTVNPAWEGDTSKFEVNAGNELWLNAPAISDTAALYTFSSVMQHVVWEFRCRMDFNPSSANYTRFYLAADQKNFSSPLCNGYYVEMGRVNDEISLYRQNGTSRTLLIDGTDGLLNTTVSDVTVKVTQDNGHWELMADTSGTNIYELLGTAENPGFSATWFTGTWNKYTATRSDKFFLDDIVITGDPVNDTTAPVITGYSVSGNILYLSLNEPVETSGINISNFTVDHGLHIMAVQEEPGDCRKIKIVTDSIFSDNVPYTLHINSLGDLSGNTAYNILYPFLIHLANPGEIMITEIMADPTPEQGLPDAEYIEICNRSDYPADLTGWALVVGTGHKNFPPYIIQPGEFVLVTDVNDTAYFDPQVHKIGIGSFPALTNGGTFIQLLDTAQQVIDEIQYTPDWYHDAVKAQGGYSLEKVNPEEFCIGENNWKASDAPEGGTPGRVNAGMDTNFIPLEVMYEWVDSLHLRLFFNQQMDTATFMFPCFNLAGLAAVNPVSEESCILVLNAPLPVNTPYILSLFTGLHDCMGNPEPFTLNMEIVRYRPALFDILVHELMTDPEPVVLLPPAEYIELWNKNPFSVNLRNYRLVVNGEIYTLGNNMVPADSCIVYTDLENIPLMPAGINTAAINGMHAITNETGMIELYDPTGFLLHAVKYDIDFYDDPAKDEGGWSLEMVDRDAPCLRNSNWTASAGISGGTPGYNNAAAGQVKDHTKPHAIHTGLGGKDTLLIYFDEAVSLAGFIPADLIFSNGLSPVSVTYASPLLDVWQVILNDTIVENTLYGFRIGNINDCAGNILVTDSLFFSVPVFPDHFDLVINELLFDPAGDCIDYVELYNRAEHSVDLSKVLVGEGDTIFNTVPVFSVIHTRSLLLNPGEYICISEDHERVFSCYAFADSTAYWDIPYLPDFTNTSGTVGVASFNQQVLDMFSYSADMHFGLLNSADGVALERLDPQAATQSAMNWHSAASTVGYGTPGAVNSQFAPDVMMSENFQAEPPVFSPDNDGYQDYLSIFYKLEEPGYTATLKIFDQVGRPEKVLVNNELLGTSGSFIWDGITDNGDKAGLGIHIIFFEIINTKGEHISFKKPVTVAVRF